MWSPSSREENACVQLFDNALLVRGSEKLRRRTRAAIDQLARDLSRRTLAIELRWELLDQVAALEFVRRASAEELSTRLRHRLHGSCREGDSLVIAGGVHHIYLKDYDISMSHQFTLPEPALDVVFEGVDLWCYPLRLPSGRISAWIDLQVHPADEERRQLPLPFRAPHEPDSDLRKRTTMLCQDAGPLDLPVTVAARVRENFVLTESTWTLLTRQGLPGSDRSLVAVARVTSH